MFLSSKSTPAVGSSSKISFGLLRSAFNIKSRLFIPPLNLLTCFFLCSYNPNFFNKTFRVERTKIIEIKNQKIGFYETINKEDKGITHGIYIIEKFRNKGIGTKIIEFIEGEFKKNNLKSSQLKVFRDNPSKKLYERLGYIEIFDSDYVDKETVVLEKKLD